MDLAFGVQHSAFCKIPLPIFHTGTIQTYQFLLPHTCCFESKLAVAGQGTLLLLGSEAGSQCTQHEVPNKEQ